MKPRTYLYIGIAILSILLISFFIKIPIDSGANYITVSPLLGIIIFNSPIVLAAYIAIALFFIYKAFGKKIKII